MRRRPVLLHPLLVEGLGAFLHHSPPELLKDGDVPLLVDCRRVAVPVLEENGRGARGSDAQRSQVLAADVSRLASTVLTHIFQRPSRDLRSALPYLPFCSRTEIGIASVSCHVVHCGSRLPDWPSSGANKYTGRLKNNVFIVKIKSRQHKKINNSPYATTTRMATTHMRIIHLDKKTVY